MQMSTPVRESRNLLELNIIHLHSYMPTLYKNNALRVSEIIERYYDFTIKKFYLISIEEKTLKNKKFPYVNDTDFNLLLLFD